MNSTYNLFKIPIDKFIRKTHLTPEVAIILENITDEVMVYKIVVNCSMKRCEMRIHSDNAEYASEAIEDMFNTFANSINSRTHRGGIGVCNSGDVFSIRNLGEPFGPISAEPYGEPDRAISFNDFCNELEEV